MKDESGDILYIGKAISIRDRVRWYFGHSSNLSPRKREMIAQVTDIEFIITETEGRALILESILIGMHSPKYNERREHPPLYEREEAKTGLSKTFYHQMRKGSTTVLILSLLSEEPMYGYQITQEMQRRSEGYFEMKEGLLYPALHQMEQDGLVKSEWRSVAGSRRRKYYSITDEGRKVLANSVAEWTTFTEKLMQVVRGHGHVEPESVTG